MSRSATRVVDRVACFERDAGLITWDPQDLRGARLDEGVARVLSLAVLLEHDTGVSADQARALGLDRDDDMASFLPQWESEEAEHARALRFLVGAQLVCRAPQRPTTTVLRRRGQAMIPLRLLGRCDATGVAFCAMGAAAEYVAIVIYTELAELAADPAVGALLRSIARQEGRHLRFLLAAARARSVSMSRREQWLARRLVRSLWTPVGVASVGPTRWWEVVGPLLDRPEVRVRLRRMDRVVDAVEHLGGLRLMGSFLDAHHLSSPTEGWARPEPPALGRPVR